jgi:hypothetical protein
MRKFDNQNSLFSHTFDCRDDVSFLQLASARQIQLGTEIIIFFSCFENETDQDDW